MKTKKKKKKKKKKNNKYCKKNHAIDTSSDKIWGDSSLVTQEKSTEKNAITVYSYPELDNYKTYYVQSKIN